MEIAGFIIAGIALALGLGNLLWSRRHSGRQRR
jgi:hypothetical protein